MTWIMVTNLFIVGVGVGAAHSYIPPLNRRPL